MRLTLPYLLLSLGIIIFPIVFSNNYYISLAIFIGIYTIVGMGSIILVGYAGQISLGQAGFYAIGAFTSTLLVVRLELPFVLALIAANLLAAFVGSLIGLVALRVKGNYLAMVTAAFSILVYVIIRECEPLTGGVVGLRNIPHPSILNFNFDNDTKYYYFVWGILLLLLIFSINFIKSRVGRAMLAIKYDEEAAETLGISTVKYKLKAFIISSCYTSTGGVLFAHYMQFIDPTSFSMMFSLTVLFIIVIGGLGSLWGAILGSSFIIAVPEILKKVASMPFFPDQLRPLLMDYAYIAILISVLTIIILIYLPNGMVSIFSRKLQDETIS